MANFTTKTPKPITERNIRNFWAKVQKRGPEECWPWVGAKGPQGYGFFGMTGRLITAHRASYLLNNGSVPKEMCVLHRCDNPNCVNPEHLFAGTHRDNIDDKMLKGRQSKGEKNRPHNPATGARNGARKYPERLKRGSAHPCAKLDEGDVCDIRAKAGAGDSLVGLARLYGVSPGLITGIVKRTRWKHLL